MKATIVVLKGNPDMEGNRIKINRMNVLLRFVRLCLPRSELLADSACFLLNIPKAEEGDPTWVRENVMCKLYWDNTNSDEEAAVKAEQLYTVYKEAGGTDEVGLGLIRYYLQDMYLIEKSASIFVR